MNEDAGTVDEERVETIEGFHVGTPFFFSGQPKPDLLVIRRSSGSKRRILFDSLMTIDRSVPFYIVGEKRLDLPLEGNDSQLWTDRAKEQLRSWLERNPTNSQRKAVSLLLDSEVLDIIPEYCQEVFDAMQITGMVSKGQKGNVMISFYDRISGASVWHQDGRTESYIALMYIPDDSGTELIPTDLRVLGEEEKRELPCIDYGDVVILDNQSLQHKGPDEGSWTNSGFLMRLSWRLVSVEENRLITPIEEHVFPEPEPKP